MGNAARAETQDTRNWDRQDSGRKALMFEWDTQQNSAGWVVKGKSFEPVDGDKRGPVLVFGGSGRYEVDNLVGTMSIRNLQIKCQVKSLEKNISLNYSVV